MANIQASDVSYTNLKRKKIEDNRKIVQANISFGDGVKTYPPGGIPLLGKMLDCPVVIDSFLIDDMNSGSSQLIKHDSVNNTLRIYNVGQASSLTLPAGSPTMGTVSKYGILAASAITNTGATVVRGDIGIYPNGASSVTGFPPGTFTGSEHAGDTDAQTAQATALAAYNDLQSRPATTIATALDGQNLTAGVYKSAGGTFTLAQSGNGTLTLTGSATDIFVFQTASTLTTGAGGTPTITLVGVLPSNVYWAVGSSATINSGSAGTFQGTILANQSVTDTLGGTVNGSLVALNAAVTLSAAATINAPAQFSPAGFELSGVVAATSIKVEVKGY